MGLPDRRAFCLPYSFDYRKQSSFSLCDPPWVPMDRVKQLLIREGKVKVFVAQLCPTVKWWTVTHQAPLSMGFSRQEYWNFLQGIPSQNPFLVLHSLLQGIFLTQGSNLVSCIAGRFFTVWATTEAQLGKGGKVKPGSRAALGQGLISPSMDTHNNIFELFCR